MTENFNEFSPSNDWTFFSKTNKYYKVFSGLLVDFNESEFICQTYFGEYSVKNSSLVTLKSWEEQKFVYSLALMSMKDRLQGESFWIGAVEEGEKIIWIEKSTTTDDNKYFENLFDDQNCYMCSSRSGKCALLDLSRDSSQYISPHNRWKFNDCDYKYGFICQLISK